MSYYGNGENEERKMRRRFWLISSTKESLYIFIFWWV